MYLPADRRGVLSSTILVRPGVNSGAELYDLYDQAVVPVIYGLVPVPALLNPKSS